MAHLARIMYIENKAGGIVGPARIGRVTFSKTRQSLHYRGRTFRKLNPCGFKANYVEIVTGEEYWISGCKKDGSDALYSTTVRIDENVREEYWLKIRERPDLKETWEIRCPGKYGG